LALAHGGCSLLAPDREDFEAAETPRPPVDPPKLVWEGKADPTSLALDADALVLTDRADGDPAAGRVVSIDPDSGVESTIATGVDSPMRVVLTTDHAWWTTGGASGSAERAPRAGGMVETLGTSTGPGLSIDVQQGSAYWTAPARNTLYEDAAAIVQDGDDVHGIAIDATATLGFYTSRDGGKLVRLILPSDKTRTLEGLSRPSGVVVIGNVVVCIEESSDEGDGSIKQLGIDATQDPPDVLVERAETTDQLAVDGTGIYWATRTGLLAVPPAGGVPQVLAESLAGCGRGVAVHPQDERVFWACRSSDGIARIFSTPKL
jgi:hypothetical protein